MTVSVIVPVYNCEDYIKKCIKSICEQTYKKLQIIVIDDGSNDASAVILDEVSKTDKRVQVIHQVNKGVCAARNEGLKRAEGEYITFIDGDDWIESDYIEILLSEALNNNSELIISGFIYDYEKKKSKIITPNDSKGVQAEFNAYSFSAACGRLYKRDIWESYNIRYVEQVGARGEDVPICLFTNYICAHIRCLDYAGYHYIQHTGSAMSEFVGLKKYGFPYGAMNDLASKLEKDYEYHNSKEILDYGIIKFFSQFYYYLGFGAEKKIKLQILEFAKKYINENCPNYKESYKHVVKQNNISIIIRIATRLFINKL